MNEPLFIDIEATHNEIIKELGLVYQGQSLHSRSLMEAGQFIKQIQPAYIAGHNLIQFDCKLLANTSLNSFFHETILVDTLPISLLLFSEKTFHRLPKNYKSEDCFANHPVKDALLSRDLFFKSIDKFLSLPESHQKILHALLADKESFQGFFNFLVVEKKYQPMAISHLGQSIKESFHEVIRNFPQLMDCIEHHPIELAHILALRMPDLEVNAQAPKILYDYPKITELQNTLCLDVQEAIQNLDKFALDNFGFANFREFARQDADLFSGNILSQREIVEASLCDQSFIAILPTGGGKTFTFWLPALIKASKLKSLTVVISPLQALIKDHMESFAEQLANYTAVALSGYLSPTEHQDAIDKVVNGDADLLYLAPESLRSNRVFNLLKNRVIDRFVIDEAHCLSTWGNDFRHDYFYIGVFIKELISMKPFQQHIPISCFTATAKPKVLDDISNYIEETLNLKIDRYIAVPERKNLDYKAYEIKEEQAKYGRLLELVNEKSGATLIYIPSSTKKCDQVAEQLAMDTEKNVRSFHSRLESDTKMQILKDYIDDNIDIVVATTAFGMGVDKPNIKNVIHYEVSESLENYAQEAGRGARNQKLRAFCPLLFESDDLDKHFTAISRSKLNADEINAVFRVLKNDKRNPVMLTSREIAIQAGWDTEDNTEDYDMKVKTALLELEREEYLQRSRNKVNFYADAVVRDAVALLDQACLENNYAQETRIRLARVLQSLLGRGKPDAVEVDELSSILGYPHAQIAQSIVQLKQLGIISDAKDLSLSTNKKQILSYAAIQSMEKKLFNCLKKRNGRQIRLTELNQQLLNDPELNLINQNYIAHIKLLLKSWRTRPGQFKFKRIDRARDLWCFEIIDIQRLEQAISNKHHIAEQLLSFFSKQLMTNKEEEKQSLEFSVLELQEFLHTKNAKLIDKALLHLHELKIVELGKGRFIYYSPMTIHKLGKMSAPNKRYTKQEYQERLKPFYQRKMESVHIIGEYSSRLLKDSQNAQSFMRDYFTLSYGKFIQKYQALKEKFIFPMTQKRHQKIFQSLSNEQQQIIDDKISRAIMILAGPGSGKTKVLVHKIASLVLQEDIKPEHFLMLTYSRTAMLEFKSRLFQLLGQLAYEIDIFTFHGYSLQLIGRQVEDTKKQILQDVVYQAAQQIASSEIEIPYKTVLVLDEYQDINADGFALVKAITEAHQNNMRIIAVGDDDQCILKGVNGADVHFIKQFEDCFGVDQEGQSSFAQYELLSNYRSQNPIVSYSNAFIEELGNRYKHKPLTAYQKQTGIPVLLYNYHSKYLCQPAAIVAHELWQQYHDIAVLAYSNNEVADIYALLLERWVAAKYLLDQQGFRLANLIEIYMLAKILAEQELTETKLWQAYDKVAEYFNTSKNLPLVKDIIQAFIQDHEFYSPSLWQSFLDEISSEQFLSNSKKVLVSTIHKAKGKEFDCVVLVTGNKQLDDEFRRLFYVGMTRAKKQLVILSTNPQFKCYAPESIRIQDDQFSYPVPIRKTLVMGLADIYLSFQAYNNIIPNQTQSIPATNPESIIGPISKAIAGSKVEIIQTQKNMPYVLVQNHRPIGCLSKKMFENVQKYEREGYKIGDIEIENVVIWHDEKSGTYKSQPLCQLVMSKRSF